MDLEYQTLIQLSKLELKTDFVDRMLILIWQYLPTLAAGYLGIKKKLKATQETKKAAYNVNVSLTESIYQSIDMFSRSKEAKEIFGETFVELFCSIKDLEVNAYNKIITAWEREYLLLNV